MARRRKSFDMLAIFVLAILTCKDVSGGVLSGADITGDTDGYFILKDNPCGSCCAQITVTTSGGGSFKITKDGTDIVGPQAVTQPSNTINLECTHFSSLPGMYTVTMEVSNGGDSFSKVMVAVLEQELNGYSVTASQIIAPPFSLITFDMSVDSGTNALFTVDCVTNIQLMKSCDGNTRNASYSQYFNETGSHTITTMVSNYGSKLSKAIVITIIYNMNDVTITADNNKPQGSEDPGIKVSMGSGADTPMGNLTGWYTCDTGEAQVSLDLSGLTPGNNVPVPCPCNGQGNRTVTVNVSTELDTIEKEFAIYCWDILNITITLEKNVQPIEDIVPFIIENTPTYGIQWSIDACEGKTLQNTDASNYNSLYSANPLDMSSIQYSEVGNCTIHATFWNEMYIVVLDLSFELSIGVNNLTAVPNAYELLTGETFTLVVNATGLDIFWAVDVVEAMIVQEGCSGLVAEHNFTAANTYVIEVMASNKVNNKSLSLTIVVAYPINGYTVTTPAAMIQSHENLQIDAALASGANTPMGNLTITISPCGTTDFKDLLPENLGATESFNCNFTVQGNYTVNVTIASSVSSETFSLEVSVCDNLAITTSVDKTAWAVDEAVTVNMNNLPISGFKYVIDMGDGSTTHTDETEALLLSANAFTAIPTKQYSTPDTYNISFLGYNQCYSVSSTLSISVLYGIPDCNLEITPSGIIFSPDDTVSFSFVTKTGSPTNNPTGVTCSWNLGDGTPVTNENKNLDFSSSSTGYTITHDYTTNGTLSYQIDCENLVSNLSFTGTVEVLEVRAVDFVVTYDDVTALDDGSCVQFDISLSFYNQVRVPQSVTYTVNYDDGDGVTAAEPLTSYTVSKNLCKRGAYTGDLTVIYNSVSNPNPLTYSLGTCRIEMTSSAINGLVNTDTFSFTVYNHLKTEAINVDIDWKDTSATETVNVPADGSVNVNHVFITHGYKKPSYSSTNSAGSDSASLDKELYLMYPVQDLELEIAEPILLGVAIEPIIHYTGNKFLVNMTCNFTYDATTSVLERGVDLDSTKKSYSGSGNAYMNIQEETLIVECQNPLSSVKLNKTFEVSSDCFEAPDIFESIHRRIESPFRAYRSSLPTLTASVKLTDKCKNTTEFRFIWTFKKRVVGTYDEFVNYSIPTPNKISMNLATTDIEEGFYLVELYMYLVERPGDYLRDRQYMQLVNPPLVCRIEGGDYVTLGQGESFVLDGSTNTYDPLNGILKASGLDFTWACYKLTSCSESDAYTAPKSTDKGYLTKEQCSGLALPQDGFITVDTSPLPFDFCYVFEMTASKDSRNCSAIQIVDVKEQAPCKIAIMCKKNCMKKVTPEEPSSFEVNIVCDGATEDQIAAAAYEWKLEIYDRSSNSFSEVAWDSNFIRGKHDKLFELKLNFFLPGKSYRLTVLAAAAGRPQSKAYITLVGNEEPRGDDCRIEPLERIFGNGSFSLICDNWMDEGDRDERDNSVDLSEPVKLRLIQDGSLLKTIDFTRKITISELPLSVGDENNDWKTTITLEVMDQFNGKVVFIIILKYSEDRPVLPSFGTASETSNKTEAELAAEKEKFNAFLDKANETVAFTEQTGDPIQTAITIAIYAKSIFAIESPVVSATDVEAVTDENAEAEMAKTLEAGTQENPAVEKIKQVNEVFMSAMKDRIDDELKSLSDKGKTPSLSTITVFANALSVTASNPKYTTPKSVGFLGDALLSLSKVLMSARNESRSTVQAENMQQAVGSLLETVVRVNSDYGVLGVDVDGEDELNTTTPTTGFNLVESNYLKALLKRREELRLKNANASLSSNIQSITTAIDNIFMLAQSLTTENSSAVMEKHSYVQSVDKYSAENIMDNARELNGSGLRVDSIEVDNPRDVVEQNMVVLSENPYVTGSNAKMAEHKVTVAYITRNGKKIKLKGAEMSQTDPIDAGYSYSDAPEFITEDPGYFFYHRFPYRSKEEQICVTVKPLDQRVCYDICLRAHIAPTEFEFDHCQRNCTGGTGVEYCAPAASCKLTGICWLGVAPFPCDDTISNPPAHRRVKRSTTNDTGTTTPASILSNPNSTFNNSNFLLSPYYYRIITLSCLSWDGAERDWRADQCTISRDAENKKTKCMCGDREDLVTTVSFFVAPNKIDFSTVFSKFDIAGQGAVLGTILVVFVLFVIFLFWARYMDGQDVLQWGVTLLEDNYRQDEYFYLITVHTGMVRHGGTKSKIGFCIAGEDDDTGVRVLSDGVREEMKAGSTMHFLMAVPQCLGTLQCFRVWHDSSGKGDSASWYLNRIEVTDLQTSDRYDFLCYQWMALEEGVLDRALALSSTENMKNFKTMFFEHARHHLTDDHLWVSVILRPVKSHFSRVQRIGCCYALLMLAMIANAMFFQSKSNKDRKQSADFTIGPISFSLSQIYISFISTIITAVPVFFIMLLFRKSKLSQKATKDGARLWMPRCFRNFKFYKQSKAIEKIMVIRDIVDDQDGVLPHFCVYISWAFAFVCVFVSAFFIMLYSMEWGKDISEEWLVTFILSFFESLIIMDPVKVLVLAVLFAILLKTIKASKPSSFDLDKIRRMVHELGIVGEGRARMDYRSPFSEEELLAAKTRCRRRNTMKKAIQELLTNSFFLILLCSITYSNRDPLGYQFHENINNIFMEPFKPAITLKYVNTTEHYFIWLNQTVIPNMFPINGFDGQKLGPQMRLRISDLTNYRVGPPRLRQVRQAHKRCFIPYVGHTDCYPAYDLATEETRNWCQSWRSHPPCPDYQALDVTNAAWTYINPLSIWGLPITGHRNVYGGGGYIANLDISRQVSEMAYNELYTQRWVDRNTRAVFLEFTLYNVNRNMFCYVSILAEFPESGGVVEFTNVYPFRSYNHLGTIGKYILVCEIVFFLFTLVWLGYIVFRLAKERWTFFKSFWNVVELLSVIISFVAVILYFIRLTYTNEAMAAFKENDREFVNFYHIAVWDSLFLYVLGFLVMIATLRLLKVMGYSRVTQIVYIVLKESSKTLPGFFFYIILVLSAYGLLGYIIFGKSSFAYKDPITTMETLFSAVLGHAGFRNTNVPVSDNWITLIYFVSFIMIVVFALSNIFMTILLDTLSMVGDDPKMLNYKEIELFAYMWDSAKTLITGKKEARGLDTSKGGPDLDGKEVAPFMVGGYSFGGFEAHTRKLQMKMDIVEAMKSNKPSYKY